MICDDTLSCKTFFLALRYITILSQKSSEKIAGMKEAIYILTDPWVEISNTEFDKVWQYLTIFACHMSL